MSHKNYILFVLIGSMVLFFNLRLKSGIKFREEVLKEQQSAKQKPRIKRKGEFPQNKKLEPLEPVVPIKTLSTRNRQINLP